MSKQFKIPTQEGACFKMNIMLIEMSVINELGV